MKKVITYEDAGVSIEKGDEAVKKIKQLVTATHQPPVLHGIGLQGGLVLLKPMLEGYTNPVLVFGDDGVGTKLIEVKPDTVGFDLVYHLANDLVTLGAKPAIMLDYIGVHELVPDIVVRIVRGMSSACIELGCSLVGGEIAEMPLIYQPGRYDLVGFMAGIVEHNSIIDGSKIKPGYQLIGLASNGVHTNGFSLAREVLFEQRGLDVSTFVECLGITIGEELSRIHRCYVGPILNILGEGFPIGGIAHVTGSGMAGNFVRILPEGCRAIINKGSWPIPPIFSFIQGDGSVDEEEMFRTFNMGIGMIIAVPGWKAGEIAQKLEWYLSAQEKDTSLGVAKKYVFQIGNIQEGEKGVQIV